MNFVIVLTIGYPRIANMYENACLQGNVALKVQTSNAHSPGGTMKAEATKRESDRLSPELLALLGTRGNVQSFTRGQLLIEEGDASDALYILVAGRLKVFTRDDKGRELVYNVLEPGEFFGELLLDGGVRSASVKAMIESQCIVVRENEIRQFLRDYPEFAESLILKLIARVRHATQQVRSLALDGVYERIVTLFNEIVQSDNTHNIPITITQQEIADRVGATREMVNHVIRDLVQGGFLRRDQDRQLVVLKKLPRKW